MLNQCHARVFGHPDLVMVHCIAQMHELSPELYGPG